MLPSTSSSSSLLRAAVLLVAAVAPTAALNPPLSATQGASHVPTRRAVLAAAHSMLLAPFAVSALQVSDDKATSLEPYVYNANAARQLAAAPFGEKAGVRFAGSYSDPNHPGCPRKVRLAGSSVIVTGADEDGKGWKVRGEAYGNKILLDFTPKGGPADVIGKWTGLGIAFPDGNVWTKL
eukprot:6207811-Pleurochrysis_carterae.AAC.2